MACPRLRSRSNAGRCDTHRGGTMVRTGLLSRCSGHFAPAIIANRSSSTFPELLAVAKRTIVEVVQGMAAAILPAHRCGGVFGTFSRRITKLFPPRSAQHSPSLPIFTCARTWYSRQRRRTFSPCSRLPTRLAVTLTAQVGGTASFEATR